MTLLTRMVLLSAETMARLNRQHTQGHCLRPALPWSQSWPSTDTDKPLKQWPELNRQYTQRHFLRPTPLLGQR